MIAGSAALLRLRQGLSHPSSRAESDKNYALSGYRYRLFTCTEREAC
jgi:hypothetical protein